MSRSTMSGVLSPLTNPFRRSNWNSQRVPITHANHIPRRLRATWELLMRNCAFTWYDDADCNQALIFESILMGETKAKEFLSRTSLKSEPQLVSTCQDQDPELTKGLFQTLATTKSLLEKKIKPVLESEVKVFEKSAEAALERTLANIAILLGICLSTGLSPWTSIKSTDATSTQLGSYALLLSVSAGVLALTTSLSHFSTVTDSARILLKLKEKMISATMDEHLKVGNVRAQNLDEAPTVGFSRSFDFFLNMAPPTGVSRHSNGGTEISGYLVTSARSWSLMDAKQCCWGVFLGPVFPFLTMYLVGGERPQIEVEMHDIKLHWCFGGITRAPNARPRQIYIH
ncbi:hypothetical protein EV127DRAFT_466037 [Xylaria flabelliformis]|nr:hypothetical protein EV127DRAFT_466037 [Xylaria flabelliformis]